MMKNWANPFIHSPMHISNIKKIGRTGCIYDMHLFCICFYQGYKDNSQDLVRFWSCVTLKVLGSTIVYKAY
jgi:hypothetical protein